MMRKTEPFELKELPDVPDLILRNLQKTDGKELGKLMYASYLGTVDYEGETLEETLAAAESILEGQYGAIIFDASFIAFQENKHNSAIAASVVTDFEKTGPLLAFSLTHPDFQKKGLAGHLIKLSTNSLNKLNQPNISLVVTSTNQPAVSLYRKLGFESSNQ